MAHILIIDDDAGVRLVTRKILESAGHEVVEAANGKEGMQRYHERWPDLVIVDLFMPEQDGLQTIRELKGADKRTRVLVITGITGGRLDFRDHAVQLGAAQALAKPYTGPQLLAAVQDVLSQETGP